MTPESHEAAELAETEPNRINDHKNQSLGPMKSKTSASQDSNDHPLKGIKARLPEPQYRTVAGHVSRRANTSAAAEPPPPSPPPPNRATSSDQRRRQRKTDSGGFGDDSDDSDSGDQRSGQGKGSPSATGRRIRPRAQDDHEPSSAGASSRPFESFQSKPLQFNKEEQERLDRRRELSIISSVWENTMQLRRWNSEQAAKRRTQMMDYLWRNKLVAITTDRQCLDTRLREYLEGSLHQAAIEAITHNVHLVMHLTYLFIHELEKEVIRRCEVNQAQHAESPSHLQSVPRNMALLRMAAFLISEVSIVETTDINIDTWSGVVNIFAEALIDKMMRCTERGQDHLSYPSVETLSANASGEERTGFFLFNRKRRGITNAYMEWLCEDVDIDSIQKCPVELLDGLRAIRRLKTLREGTRQEFISYTEVSNGAFCLRVSLVMFKGNQPLRTQRVELDELSRMGWIHDKRTLSFWRSSLLQATVTGEQVTSNAMFKVDMDGAVLAIQGPDGQWIDWKDIEGGAVRPQGASLALEV